MTEKKASRSRRDFLKYGVVATGTAVLGIAGYSLLGKQTTPKYATSSTESKMTPLTTMTPLVRRTQSHTSVSQTQSSTSPTEPIVHQTRIEVVTNNAATGDGGNSWGDIRQGLSIPKTVSSPHTQSKAVATSAECGNCPRDNRMVLGWLLLKAMPGKIR